MKQEELILALRELETENKKLRQLAEMQDQKMIAIGRNIQEQLRIMNKRINDLEADFRAHTAIGNPEHNVEKVNYFG